MLTVSTGHLRASTREWIEAGYVDSGLTVYPKGDYGWFIYTGAVSVEDTPNELVAAIQFARTHNCTWLVFDVDANQTEGLVWYGE